MRKYLVPIHILLPICMLLCSFSLFAFGSSELSFVDEQNKIFDVSQADNPDNPTLYINTSVQVRDMPGYVGSIKYIGPSTDLIFTQIPSTNPNMLYFTHNSDSSLFSEYFLVGKVRALKNDNTFVTFGNANTIIADNTGTVSVPVNSGTINLIRQPYKYVLVDLALIRKNQARQDMLPRGDYASNITVRSSDDAGLRQIISLVGRKECVATVTAWFSITQEEQEETISLSQALTEKLKIGTAEIVLEGYGTDPNYGVDISFRDNAFPSSDTFMFRPTNAGVSSTIPFALFYGNNSTQTTLIDPATPILWDALSITTNMVKNRKNLYLSVTNADNVHKAMAGSYQTTIRVEITAWDNVILEI